jgi:hypothetical protein
MEALGVTKEMISVRYIGRSNPPELRWTKEAGVAIQNTLKIALKHVVLCACAVAFSLLPYNACDSNNMRVRHCRPTASEPRSDLVACARDGRRSIPYDGAKYIDRKTLPGSSIFLLCERTILSIWVH